MKAVNRVDQCWWAGIIGGLGLLGGWFALSLPAVAQLIPDNTLGAERSVIAPIDQLNDRINGGAVRGSNLFHSFREFNVGEGRGVYFANPDGIVNILSRVTGGNPSNILGRLGVLGNANLFLINPNGIVFGEQASLDINGSFVATTAEAIALGDQGFFSATQPQQSQLLSVAPAALFFNQLPNPTGRIQSAGNLTVGQDFTLAADNLALQGRLQAGGNLTLQAQDTVQIRDSVTQPFIASAGGQLLVQGNQLVDIFALNHPQSGLFSGGDMVLRSANTVRGDAHYSAGGMFRIEQLDGTPGNLFSPYDPIIYSNGDIIFGSYTGTSLHILAGGSVTIGTVSITGLGDTNTTISPTNNPFTAAPLANLPPSELANVRLSDGTLVVIDGSAVPTLDIRAGIDWAQLGGLPGNGGIDITGLTPANFQEPPSSANITIQNIENNFLNSVVLLTNQFKPNLALPTGTITIGPDRTTAFGLVAIDARGTITATGDIVSNLTQGDGGNIKLISQTGGIDTRGVTLNSSTGAGNGGNISLIAFGDITLGNVQSSTSGLGKAGDITLKSDANISMVGSIVDSTTSGNGRGGDITIAAKSVSLLASPTRPTVVRAETSGGGRSGDISITTQFLTVADGSEILARTVAAGDAGNITIQPFDPSSPSVVTLSGYAPFTGLDADNIPIGGYSSGLFVSTENPSPTPANPNPTPATGNGGTLTISGITTLNIDNGAVLSARSKSPGSGQPVSILINVNDLNLTNGGEIIAAAYSTGAAGNILIKAAGTVTIAGQDSTYLQRLDQITQAFLDKQVETDPQKARSRALTTVDPLSPSSAIVTSDLNLTDLDPSGQGKPGSILIVANAVRMSNIGLIEASTNGSQDGGTVGVFTQTLALTEGSEIISQTFGSGKAGDIVVAPLSPESKSSASVFISGTAPFPEDGSPEGGFSSGLFASTEQSATGQGGTIRLTTGSLILDQAGAISARSRGAGNVVANPGDTAISIDVDTLQVLGGSQILTTAFSSGQAGGIEINATGNITISGTDPSYSDRFDRLNEAYTKLFVGQGQTQEDAQKNAQDITETIIDTTSLTSGVQAQSLRTNGTGSGNIEITSTTGSITITDNAEIDSSIAGQGAAGIILLRADQGTVSLDNARVFSTVESGAVNSTAGGIGIRAQSIFLTNGAQLQTLIRGPNEARGLAGGVGTAGAILLLADDKVSLSGKNSAGNDAAIISSIEYGATATDPIGGGTGAIGISAKEITLFDAARIDVSTAGVGNAGDVLLETNGGTVTLDNSTIFSTVEAGGEGNGGNISIDTGSLLLKNSGELQTLLRGPYTDETDPSKNRPGAKGNAGVVLITATDRVSLVGRGDSPGNLTGIFTTIQEGANGSTGDNVFAGNVFNEILGLPPSPPIGSIFIKTGSLSLTDGAVLDSSTFGEGNAGAVVVLADGAVSVKNGSSVSSIAGTDSSGNAGGIVMGVGSLFISNDSDLTTKTENQGGFAGVTFVAAKDSIRLDRRSEIKATTQSGDGGDIFLDVMDKVVLLRRDSQISTTAGLRPAGGNGGNITIMAPYIVAAPSKNNDITAEAFSGAGGQVQITAKGVFGIKPRPLNPRTNDISASSTFGPQGVIVINALDTAFIQNGLTEFPQTLIDTNALLSNSCIVRRRQQQGSFVITGSDGLPVRPGDAAVSSYPTGTVRSVPGAADGGEQRSENSPKPQGWKLGDPIVEPQGVYQLPTGQLVMSRECSE